MKTHYCSYCSREFDCEDEFWDHEEACSRKYHAAPVGLGFDTLDEYEEMYHLLDDDAERYGESLEVS